MKITATLWLAQTYLIRLRSSFKCFVTRLFQYNLYFIILSVTVIISATVAFAAWQRRSISLASKPFILNDAGDRRIRYSCSNGSSSNYPLIKNILVKAGVCRLRQCNYTLPHIRRYFDEIFSKELIRATRDSTQVTLIIMDIDYFKNINDTFGHQAGDRVIHAFVNLLRHYTHPQDIVCRYGGDKFVLVLLGLTQEKAFQYAEQIRLSFQAARLESGSKEIYTTVAGGVAVFPDHGKTTDE
jgi:diguanylate cyclase (GGDEF)-like protein